MNKKDIDKQVKNSISRLSENEKNLRGFVIAKLYFKVGEFGCAQHWLTCYLEQKEEHAEAHKLLGQCYEKINKPDRAITSYQRSLQLNTKQTSLISDICRLLLADETTLNPAKAKHWCDLAESNNLRDDSILNLRLKMLNKDNKNDSKPVEEMILKEIASRPSDPGLRIRLVKYLVDEKRGAEAFKYCFEIEMKFIEAFQQSIDWYHVVAQVLAQHSVADNWTFWCLRLITLERQIYLTMKKDLSLYAVKQNIIKEVTTLIFEFDQVLKKASEVLNVLVPVKDLAAELITHFRGQLCLHLASLMFQKEKVGNTNQWRDVTKKCLPLLFLAYQCGTVNDSAFWLKNTNDVTRQLCGYLKKEGSFRCVQAARTLLSCVSNDGENPVIAQIRQVTNNRAWNNFDDVLDQVRKLCADSNWRKTIFRVVFVASDQQAKISNSFFVQSALLTEPHYDSINIVDVQCYEDQAQYLYPSSLEHQVYLGLGRAQLSSYKSNTFSKLNLSTSNLINCNPETLNQIDVDSFLYCGIMQTKRYLEAEKQSFESFSGKPSDKPLILPAANMIENLCNEEQQDWWLSAHKIYKNISGENLAQLKAILQYGIEAVRGIDTPKIDLILLLKLGEILLKRARSSEKMEEKQHLELRVESIYKFCLKMLRNKDSDNMRRLFKFSTSNYNIEREVSRMAEDAVTFLAGIYFKKGDYKECIDDFNGLQLPFATYFQAEAYRKLDESSKTPKKTKKIYIEKAREHLTDTLNILETNSNFDKSHPLHSVIQTDLKRLHYSSTHEDTMNASSNGFTDDDMFQDAFSSSFRVRRDASFQHRTSELESMVRKLLENMSIVKDDVLNIRNDVTDVKDKLDKVEEILNKKSTSSETEAALNDMYMMDEMNPSYMNSLASNYMPYDARTTPISQAGRLPPNPVNPINPYNPMLNTAYPMYMQQYSLQNQMRAAQGQIPGVASPLPYGDLTNDIRANLLMTAAATQSGYYQQMAQQIPNVPGLNPLQAIPNIQMPPPQITPTKPTSMIEQALATPSVLNTWNNTYNMPQNMHIPPPAVVQQPPPPPAQIKVSEKQPPVNVVITSSDPLPAHTTTFSQPPMSVKIPPQHIKHHVQPTPAVYQAPVYEAVSPELVVEDVNYDPCPDFKPIIDLPDEIVVKTGEEDEDVIFCEQSKVFRFVEKEWKERGIGKLKILKHKTTNQVRILMRRDQVHKVCVNHLISSELNPSIAQSSPKSVLWVANDFSEDQLMMEKFLARFKTPELASNFLEKFEEAKKIAGSGIVAEPTKETKETPKSTFSFNPSTVKVSTPKIAEPPVAKVEPTKVPFKAFTFGTEKAKEPAATPAKPSPFANFSFGGKGVEASPNKSFQDIFSGINSSPVITVAPVNIVLNRSNNDDETAADDFVPSANFEPVIPLPDLIESKTGEEDEHVKFEHRAKLLRFESSTKEWKEKGLGNMKVLVDKKDPQKARLLMRREQVLKVCCNQLITKELKFTKLPKNEVTLSWYGSDFSENEVKSELLAVKFKTPDLTTSFHEAVLEVQKNMGEDKPAETSKEAKKEVKKVEEVKGFGDKFKPTAGSWNCEACYISNKSEVVHCVACDSPKDNTVAKKPQGLLASLQSTPSKFTFGVQPPNPAPAAVASQSKTEEKKDGPKGFGDKFKPSAGSWDCEACYISNKSDSTHCVACESPKDNTVAAKPQGLLASLQSAPSKFTFGVPAANTTVPSSEPSKFTFGNQTASTTTSSGFGFGSTTAKPVSSSSSFGFPQPTGSTFAFGNTPSFAGIAPVVTSTNTTTSSNFSYSFGNTAAKPEEPSTDLGFSFVSRAPNKPSAADDQDNDNEYHEEEENNTYFQPVIALPDKVEIRTGEEEEEVLYAHRAKLFRYCENEWKERGLGDVKILKHKETGKLRVVMRREQVLKICLNHQLTDEIHYVKKEDKVWQFAASDYSEGAIENLQFCLRFKTADIADGFKEAIDDALAGNEASVLAPTTVDEHNEEDKKLTEKLKLPANFFDYKTSENCKGCRGCKSDEFVFPVREASQEVESVDPEPLPSDLSKIKIQKKVVDKKSVSFNLNYENKENEKVKELFEGSSANIFNNKTSSVESKTLNITNSGGNIFGNSTMFAQATNSKPNNENTTSIFGGNNSSAKSIFSSSLNTTPVTTSSSTETTISTPIFGAKEPASATSDGSNIFGGKSNFSFGSAGSSIFGTPPVPGNDSASLFASSHSFSSPTSSIFGNAAATFGQSVAPSASQPVFGSSSIATTFSFAQASKDLTADTPTNIFKSASSVPSFGSLADSSVKKSDGTAVPDFLQKESTSFASLASAVTPEKAASAETSAKPGAGGFFGLTIKEDIFTKLAKQKNGEEVDLNSSANEEYDPHYDPIISLPDEIKVSTGEEEEEKVFGERAKLFRYDTVNREWKERGVGDFKILHHPQNGTYRLLLRREQIFKLVLNQLITNDFAMQPMNNSGKAYCWGGMNYAETPAVSEQLAVRFKNDDLAQSFKNTMEKCLEKLKSRELVD